MKKLIKLLGASFLQSMLIAFIQVAVKKINQNHSLDQLTKEKFISALYSIDIEDFIKNI